MPKSCMLIPDCITTEEISLAAVNGNLSMLLECVLCGLPSITAKIWKNT